MPVHVTAVAERGGLYRFGYLDSEPVLLAAQAGDVAAGPGSKVWFTTADDALSSWDNGIIRSYHAVKARRIAAAPDGRVWFTTPEGRIGIFTESGAVQNLPGNAVDIAVGQGGAVWMVATDGTPYVVTTDNRIAWIDRTPEEKQRTPAASASSGTGVVHQDGEVRRVRTAAVGRSLKVIAMGDGYVAEDLQVSGEYDREVDRLVEALLDLPPFRYFRDRIDVYTVYVRSNQKGADTTPDAADRDTALGASFYSDGLDQRILRVHDTAAMERYAKRALPSWDLLLVSVNDKRFGGTGSALVSVASRDPMSVGIMMHEIGHSFAALGDEYGGVGQEDLPPASNALRYPNLDVTADPARVQWSALIGKPRMEKVGVYEGGFYRNRGIFRPQENCIMRFHNMTDRYCAVCEQVMYRKLCSLLDIPYSREEFLRIYEP